MSLILAIDPGPTESAYVIMDADLKPREFGKILNDELLAVIDGVVFYDRPEHMVIEMIASYGMPVGATVFETCVWIGRFIQAADPIPVKYIYRKEEKLNLCGTTKAKDGNIRQALIDRFGPVGVKKKPGWFYGVSKDVWAAIAVGVTYFDMYIRPNETKKKKVED